MTSHTAPAPPATDRATTSGRTSATAPLAPSVRAAPSAAPHTMRALVQDRYGSADVLRIEDVELPAVGPDEVLVRVAAAGIDRGTVHLMTGHPYLVRLAGYGVRRPRERVPGMDVAGTVERVGSDVTRVQVADRVAGIASGSLAQYAVAPEEKLVRLPDSVTDEQGAVVSVSGITALQALTDVGGLAEGQRVLVVGASGGVGSYAVQIAAALGAHVTGVAGTDNVELVRSLGAESVINHRHEALDACGGDYDLVVDVGGRNPLRRLRSVLAEDGTLVIVGGEGGNRLTGGVGRQVRAALLSPFVRQRLAMLVSEERADSIEQLVGMVADGSVVPAIGHRTDLDGAADAIALVADGRSRGKTVVRLGTRG